MGSEIELKLALPESAREALTEHPLLASVRRERRALYNRYFDTPDRRLNAAAVALRIRRQGSQYIQTLKTRGTSQGGLHARQEWEWALPDDELAPALLPADGLPEGVDLQTLEAVFSTDFTRTLWHITEGGSEIEVALDEGWVRAGERSDPICELELELKRGEPADLFRLARALAESVPLRISRISKAERGFRLAEPERARELPPRAEPLPGQPPRGWVFELLDSLLERIQASIEGYLFLQEANLLLPLEEELGLIRTLFDCWSSALGAETLRSLLVKELDELQRLLAPTRLGALLGDESIAQDRQLVCDAELDGWLERRELGLLLLDLAVFCQQRRWH